jgi:hypothetical protein
MGFGMWVFMAFWMSNFILLFNRQSKWVQSNYKWHIAIVLFVAGAILWYLEKSANYQINLVFLGMTTPAFFSLIDYGFKKLSFAIHRRDFYLWLRGSADLNNHKLQFKASDRIISILLLYITLGIPLAPYLLAKLIQSLV